jgi:hypothetical protein
MIFQAVHLKPRSQLSDLLHDFEYSKICFVCGYGISGDKRPFAQSCSALRCSFMSSSNSSLMCAV